MAISPSAGVGEKSLRATGWTGPTAAHKARLETKVLPWVSLGKDVEAAAAGTTSALERAEILNTKQTGPEK